MIRDEDKRRRRRVVELEEELRAQFGGRVLSLRQVGEALGSTAGAVQRAQGRGQLPFIAARAVGRRGYVVPTRVVAEYLAEMEG